MSTSDSITIRRAGAADATVLARLAALDSALAPGADSLVAEAGGRAVAALDLDDGRIVADPFARTAEVVELLRLRAERVRGHEGRRRRGAKALVRRPLGSLIARA
jgi:hypothetical protein